ncbi:MAG: hypothetical protein ABI646_05800 [Acidobacteriota bacterium]
MKNIKNATLKVMVMIALFCGVALADGEMGGGGLADSGDTSKTGKAVVTMTAEDGEMGGGGFSYYGSVVDSIYDYLDRIL